MRAAIQVRDQPGARVAQQKAWDTPFVVLELEGLRLPRGEPRGSADSNPLRTQASAARDGPGGCAGSGSPAVSSFISSRHSGLPLRWVISTFEASKKLF